MKCLEMLTILLPYLWERVKFNASFKYIRQIISNKSDVEDEVLKIDNEFFDELN